MKTIPKRALISVSNKEGLVDFARELLKFNIEIIATGGTANLLTDSGISITNVELVTSFPEIMGGRVKTLHPKIHGGILARRGIDEGTMEKHGIQGIDIVVVNLYPFEQKNSIENIDIGGPAMLRSAAKNNEAVTVVVNPNDYKTVLSELKKKGYISDVVKKDLAGKAFSHTAKYDTAIAAYFQKTEEKQILSLQQELRYGENPHQKSSSYKNMQNSSRTSLINAKQHQGKPLSFNNLMDSDLALKCVRGLEHSVSACAIVKHATPCGVAHGNNLVEAYDRALSADPSSAFGGIIAFNQEVNEEVAEKLSTLFTEVIIAPTFSKNALEKLQSKKNCRIIEVGYGSNENTYTFHSISGGLLIQETDELLDDEKSFKVVTRKKPSEKELKDAYFAWRVVRYVKSNAIVCAKNSRTIGIGAGQTSRVFSAKIAAMRAEEESLSLTGAVMASDAFFPFADSIDLAAKLGIRCIIQPGGSVRDNEVIEAADRMNISMILTNKRHFRH